MFITIGWWSHLDGPPTKICIGKFGKIIKERNPKLFCRKIIEITENKSLFNSFSKAAYKLSEKFCAKKIAREVDKIVQNSL